MVFAEQFAKLLAVGVVIFQDEVGHLYIIVVCKTQPEQALQLLHFLLLGLSCLITMS